MKKIEVKKRNLYIITLVVLLLSLIVTFLIVHENRQEELEALGIDTSSKESLEVTKKLSDYKIEASDTVDLTDGSMMGLVISSPLYLEGMIEFNKHITKALDNEEYLDSEAWSDKLLEITAENYVYIHSMVYDGSDIEVSEKLHQFQEGYVNLEKQVVKLLIEDDEFNLDLLVDEITEVAELSRGLTDAIAKNYN